MFQYSRAQAVAFLHPITGILTTNHTTHTSSEDHYSSKSGIPALTIFHVPDVTPFVVNPIVTPIVYSRNHSGSDISSEDLLDHSLFETVGVTMEQNDSPTSCNLTSVIISPSATDFCLWPFSNMLSGIKAVNMRVGEECIWGKGMHSGKACLKVLPHESVEKERQAVSISSMAQPFLRICESLKTTLQTNQARMRKVACRRLNNCEPRYR
ncbi:hypothetical protein EI94DRAFT_1699691 [Lactarius quietus]|nr:hypothetical protein EI94DRAFT_1699691 [Lactarius quietus]